MLRLAAWVMPKPRSTPLPREKHRWHRKRCRKVSRSQCEPPALTTVRLSQVVLSLEKLTQLAQVDRPTLETESVQRALEGMHKVVIKEAA